MKTFYGQFVVAISYLSIVGGCGAPAPRGSEGRASAILPRADSEPRHTFVAPENDVRAGAETSAQSLTPGRSPFDAFVRSNFGVLIEADGSDIVIRGRELDEAANDWSLWTRREPTAFERVVPTMLHSNEFIVLGELQNGDLAVERWLWPKILGAYYAEFDPTVQPIGVPVRTGDTTVEVEGGVFVEARYRFPRPDVGRSPVLALSGVGRVLAANIDPDGRFLILLRRTASGDSVLSQVPLSPVGPIVDLVTSQQCPSLGAGSARICAGDFARQGRIHTINVGSDIVYLSDPNNDGVINGWNVMDVADFEDAFPHYSWSRTW